MQLTNSEINEKLNKLIESQERILQLMEENAVLQKKVNEYIAVLADKDQKIADLNETVEYFKRMIFGSKSEKKSMANDFPGQMSLFTETSEDEEIDKHISSYVRKEKKKKHKSTYDELFAGLPREKRLIPASPDDRICPTCGEEMTYLGEKSVRTEVEVIPAKVKVIEIYQGVYVCKKCSTDEATCIKASQVPLPLIDHSYATPSLVGYAMSMKYRDYLPAYRQEQIWKEMGLKISRATLSNWMIDCADRYFVPVYNRLHKYLNERDILCADETTSQVLREKGKTPQSKSYMWFYCTVMDGQPAIALYEYQPSREGKHAGEFLKDFKGKYVVCDGYQGYNKLPDGIIRCGCLAHVRRKWFDAIPAERRKRRSGEQSSTAIPAEIGYDFCNQLFEKEKKLSESADPSERKRIREVEEPEIWKSFWEWLQTLRASDGSRLGKAISYTLNQRPVLENYLLDERIPISNNFAENCARPYAVARKNFLFHTSVEGARSSAVILSLVETAKRNGLNVLKYLTEVLTIMKDCKHTEELIDSILPWSERIQQSCKN